MVQIFVEMPSDSPEEIFEDFEHAHQAMHTPAYRLFTWFKFLWFLFSL